LIVFIHTEVDARREELGLGSILVQSALDQVRDATTYRVVARCPFVAHWLTKHEEYHDLLTR
jgi:predicted GNAT family acetyltransferase